MAGKIFISYRRGDDAGYTQALFQRLEDQFALGEVFMDVEGHIRPGDDFAEVLNANIATADVVLAVIGPRWVELLAAREGEADDFLVIEIKAALEQRKRVIPVLVGGASLPRADSLPEAIRPLVRRHAVGLRPDRFSADCQGLVTALMEGLADAEKEREAQTPVEREAAAAPRIVADARAEARAKAAGASVQQRASPRKRSAPRRNLQVGNSSKTETMFKTYAIIWRVFPEAPRSATHSLGLTR